MSAGVGPPARAIFGAFKAMASSVLETAPDRWSLALRNGVMLSAAAALTDGWLIVDVPMPVAGMPIGKAVEWEILGKNASLPPLVKLTRPPGARVLSLRAEVPVDGCENESDLRTRVLALCEALQSASAELHGHSAASPAAVALAPPSPDLAELVDAAGWQHTLTRDASLTVDLPDVKGTTRPFEATIQRRPDAAILVSVILAEAAPAALHASSRDSLTQILLYASGHVRMVRAVIEETAEQVITRAEALLPADAGAAGLSHALAALAVMCRLCAGEVKLVYEVQAIAVECLRAWSKREGRQG